MFYSGRLNKYYIFFVTFFGHIYAPFSLSQNYINNDNLMVYMKKTEVLVIRITVDQKEILEKRAKEQGLGKISDYVRLKLFSDKAI